MGVRIHDLPAAATLTGAELIELEQGGISVKGTATDVAALGGGGSLTSFGFGWDWAPSPTDIAFVPPGSENFYLSLVNGVAGVSASLVTADVSISATEVGGNGFSLTSVAGMQFTSDGINLVANDGSVFIQATQAVNISSEAAINLSPATGLELNGDPGGAGQVMTSLGPGAPPVWANSGGGSTPGIAFGRIIGNELQTESAMNVESIQSFGEGNYRITFTAGVFAAGVPQAASFSAIGTGFPVRSFSNAALLLDINGVFRLDVFAVDKDDAGVDTNFSFLVMGLPVGFSIGL